MSLDSSSDFEEYLPELPPDLAPQGPSLIGPSFLKKEISKDEFNNNQMSVVDQDAEMGYIGPLPPSFNSEHESQLVASRRSPTSMENPDKTVDSKREEWMTVPPSFSIASAKLTNRRFAKTTKEKAEFDESWTALPGEEINSANSKGSKNSKNKMESDDRMEELIDHEKEKERNRIVEEYNKKYRPATLMQMHLDKIQEKKSRKSRRKSHSSRNKKHKSSSDSEEEWKNRRFNRDRDLAVNWKDTKRHKDVLSQTKFLSDKYSHGSSGSFL
ncbi:hypothetical protein BB560_000696 [Smittium megazygosporum]|uniref:DUF3752 domain-containing protein n=1 Tax=Smittium megazygosporum TaxID=133381 RepID=A0A2T9ZJR3_9FUNG|nr:hypothetical protein BB560_000696 [Smittium megazygosporum]